MIWQYDRSASVHHCGEQSTVHKQGDGYVFIVDEGHDTYVGVEPALGQAKQAVERRLQRPEPSRQHCHDCLQVIACEVGWSGAPYYFWTQSWPGAIQPVVSPAGDGFYTVFVCSACLDKRKEAK